MKLTNFSNETVKIKYPQEFKHLAPQILADCCKFTLSGINSAIAGAIIRTMGGELPVSYMEATLETNDIYIIPNMVISRIRMIPIMQNIPIGSKYSLNFVNKTQLLEVIKSGEIKPAKNSNEIPFNQNITLCKLNSVAEDESDTFIKMNITVESNYSYIPGFGGLSHSYLCTALPEENYNPIEHTGIKTPVSNSDTFNFQFKTHGTINSRQLLLITFQNIIERVQRIAEFLEMKTVENNIYKYNIIDESVTIGNLFEKLLVFAPDVNTITCSCDVDSYNITLTLSTNADPDVIITNGIKSISAVFEKLKKMF
jgi:DNA-directed RNA polymerase subunit L